MGEGETIRIYQKARAGALLGINVFVPFSAISAQAVVLKCLNHFSEMANYELKLKYCRNISNSAVSIFQLSFTKCLIVILKFRQLP